MRLCLTILALFFLTALGAQNGPAWPVLHTYRGDVAQVAADNLGNFYVVSSTGQVKKFSERGDSLAVFNGVRNYGKLHAIDVTNPLKPLLFYRDFASVVVLDRLLSLRTSIDLRRYNILQPTAITLSYDNNIWVFDQFDNKLKKLDEAGTVLLQTTDFRQLFNETISPQKLINDNGLLYLADSAKGVFVFDNYGAFKKRIQLQGWTAMDAWNGQLVRLGSQEIILYNPTNFTERTLRFPPSFTPYSHTITNHNRLITFSSDSLRIYRIGF